MVGWVITKDHIEAGRVGYGQGVRDEADTLESFNRVIGRTVYMATDLQARDVASPVTFRLLDDDGEVYYEGVIAREWLDGDESRAFAPLRFAMTDAGATELQYRQGAAWRTL